MGEIEELKINVEKDLEDFLMKKIDESLEGIKPVLDELNKKVKELEERVDEIDLTVQNFFQTEGSTSPEEIHKEIFKRLDELEDEIKDVKKSVGNISISKPTVIE